MVEEDPTIEMPVATDATLAAPPSSTRNGALPARYRIAGSLGAGGMGEVLLATDTQIDRDVAIKRMLIDPTGPAVARFLREAKVQGRLDHPAIVPVYELAHDSEGRPFFVMKRLAGTTLAHVIRDTAYPRQKLLRAFADVCLAIELAHSRGVIHRDLKPANIMLGDFGEVYVLDWGIARVQGETDPEISAPSTGEQQLTQVGAILGTPGYIPPEVVRGEAIDTSGDVFALGAILFEILAGKPLVAHSVAAVLDDFEARPSVRTPDRDVPPELDAAVVAAVAPREHRLSARALADRIESFLDGDRDLAQRKKLAATHLELARAAAAIDDRPVAMREAGRALALDPRSEAADLLGRLMLEPPKQVPREVEERLADLDDKASRTKAKSFMPSYIACIVGLPIMLLIGLHGALGIGLYLGTTAINIAACSWVIHKRKSTNRYDMAFAMAMNLALVLATSWLFGPVMIAPGIAIVVAIMFASDPRLHLWRVSVAAIGSLLIPFVLEQLGIWPAAFIVVDGDIRVHANAFTAGMPETHIAFVIYFTMIVLVSAYTSRRLANNERAALKAVELQAWHLRQLVNQA